MEVGNAAKVADTKAIALPKILWCSFSSVLKDYFSVGTGPCPKPCLKVRRYPFYNNHASGPRGYPKRKVIFLENPMSPNKSIQGGVEWGWNEAGLGAELRLGRVGFGWSWRGMRRASSGVEGGGGGDGWVCQHLPHLEGVLCEYCIDCFRDFWKEDTLFPPKISVLFPSLSPSRRVNASKY